MATIGLIRHGLTAWNELGKAQGISDISLNEKGLRQANAIAERVSGGHWDIVCSSTLTRALQTAEAICDKLGINSIITDDRLREINCGLIEGTTEDERIFKWGKNWRSQNIGMEPFEEVAKRGMEFIEEVCSTNPDKRILIVSHGALIGLTLQHLLPQVFPKTHIDNASITMINLDNNGWECSLYNCTRHLESMNLN
ncbi:histidine phosphatase family protein [Paenibacillus albiflavus]|uniref:Histidine phosphatase family protein n=1 Tax=Paenibacillus albiflavus TaxID=2545760 RepID=A0A4R4ELL4_9BACL|nr:histidine phosphatase family protein [Paenibacillus albiflavus]TCZ79341.1 histidine phosphatase family protein [Paenibacillus albiflavus]